MARDGLCCPPGSHKPSGSRGRDRGRVWLCTAVPGRQVRGLPTLGGSCLDIKHISASHTAEKAITQKDWRCSVFVKKKTIRVSQTYNVPYAGASGAVILPHWRQQLKVPSFKELSISFMFLSTSNPPETE